MFGPRIEIEEGGLSLVLKPGTITDVPQMAKGFSDMLVIKYLTTTHGVTEDTEKEWMDKVARDSTKLLWFIYLKDTDFAIGSTGLHNINNHNNSCVSGFCLWDKSYWGKGIASLAHVARTWFAGTQLNRFTITSEVLEPNAGSYKALEKVGYIRTGFQPGEKFVDGHFVGKYAYTWMNPIYTNVLFPTKVPDEYLEGLKKAQNAIERGYNCIKF